MKPYTPHEFKVQCVRECEPMTELLAEPDQVAQYWRQNIPKADWYDPMKEAFVVLVLNARKLKTAVEKCGGWRSKSASPSEQRELDFQVSVKLLIPLRGRSSRRGSFELLARPLLRSKVRLIYLRFSRRLASVSR